MTKMEVNKSLNLDWKPVSKRGSSCTTNLVNFERLYLNLRKSTRSEILADQLGETRSTATNIEESGGNVLYLSRPSGEGQVYVVSVF